MMKAEYALPLKVKIESENPDKVVVAVARAIQSCVPMVSLEKEDQVEVEYTIYKKPDPETFGK